MTDDAPEQTFAAAARALGRLGVAYLHIIEPGAAGDESRPAGAGDEPLGSGWFRDHYAGRLISAGGHTAGTGRDRLAGGEADLIAYGKPFIANPDLVERLRTGAPLAIHDPNRVYGGGADGYVDYPRATAPSHS